MSNKIFSRSGITSGYKKSNISDENAYLPAYESIQTITGDGSSGSITFTSIPTKFKHLQIRGIARGTRSFIGEDLYFRFNGDAGGSSYYFQEMYANPPSNASVGNSGVTSAIRQCQIPAGLAPANVHGTFILDIYDWKSTVKTKTTKGFGGHDTNDATTGYQYHNIWHTSGMWLSTAAITSVTLVSNGPYTTTSSFALYGVL
jgi:hypothetical protein